jgi:predicted ester cyclase
MNDKTKINKAAATHFIEAFNTDDWEAVREVVAPNFTLNHPLAGTVQLGPEGMVAAWSGDKAKVPDMWHPIPVMITEGDYLAVLLPTYGHFTGEPYHGIPATGEWMEYGMVNMVRLEEGRLAEAWFGMDPLVEMQQMGAAPAPPPRRLNALERANVELFQQTINTAGRDYDQLTAFGDTVIAFGPPQHEEDTRVRRIEFYCAENGGLKPVQAYEFMTNPPYAGDPAADTELSRSVVTQFFAEVLVNHDLHQLAMIADPDILIHPTAMPCEASYYGLEGVRGWLAEQWQAFPDLTIGDYFMIGQGDIIAVRWKAKGTSTGSFMMLPPTGETVAYTGVSMYRIKNGKIAEIWETRNTWGIMRQLNPEIGSGPHTH